METSDWYSTRLHRRKKKKRERKEDDSFGISAAICWRIYPLWSTWARRRIYALYLLICLTAVTGLRALCLPFQGKAKSSPSCSPIIFANTTSCPVFRIAPSGANNVGECSPPCPLSCPFLTASSRVQRVHSKNFEEPSLARLDSLSFVHDASCPS